jgi:hypothetical protein
MMAALAIVGLVLGCNRMWARHVLYREKAAGTTHYVQLLRFQIECSEPNGQLATLTHFFLPKGIMRPTTLVQAITLKQYYERLASRYDYAARYPWVFLGPDPPPPDAAEQ